MSYFGSCIAHDTTYASSEALFKVWYVDAATTAANLFPCVIFVEPSNTVVSTFFVSGERYGYLPSDYSSPMNNVLHVAALAETSTATTENLLISFILLPFVYYGRLTVGPTIIPLGFWGSMACGQCLIEVVAWFRSSSRTKEINISPET